MKAGKLDRRITFERRTVTQDPVYGTDIVTWVPVATVWATVRDDLPTRSEKAERDREGIRILNRPVVIWCWYRSDITSDMRILYDGRVLKITGGPAQVGRREGLQLTAEEFSTQGDGP